VKSWPQHEGLQSTEEIVRLYNQGFAGAYHSQRQKEKLLGEVTYPDGEVVCDTYGFTNDGKGKLSIPFLFAYKHWPKCWPCPGQSTGDCTSHAGKNAGIITIGVEVTLGEPDEATGIIEGWPEVTEEAEKQGVVACENIYGERGHRGQGASCYKLIRYVTGPGGIMLRKNYPDLNLDLTRYNARIGINWGGSGTPSNVDKEGNKHKIREATECKNHEVVRDMVARGFPIWACSGLGWSSKRDENGYSRKSGSWSHSWVVAGYDDRADTVRKYGFPLFLFLHDWGRWNSGGRRIMGTDIDIPEGTFWGDARLLNKCECTAIGGLNGWKRKKLPDYLTGVL